MHIYTAHVNPDEPHPYEQPQFVREGFNWYAFLFGALWAIYHRLWLLLALIVAMEFALAALVRAYDLSVLTLAIMQLGLRVWVAFEAGDFLRAKLKKQGFITSDVVTGETRLAAEQRFFSAHC